MTHSNAELAMLGGVLINPDVFPAVLDTGLLPSHIEDDRVRLAFEACVAIHESGVPLDALLIMERIQDHSAFGGEAYRLLAEATDAVPTSANTVYYAGRVIEQAAERAAEEVRHEIAQMARRGLSLDEIAAYAETQQARASTTKQFGVDDFAEWQTLGLAGVRGVFRGGLLPIGTVALLCGEPATHKTTLALQLALAVATGRKIVLDPEERAPVLCLFGEDSREILSMRIRAVAAAYSIPPEAITAAITSGHLDMRAGDVEPLFEPSPRGIMQRTPAFASLRKRLKPKRYGLVVADPLLLWTSPANENDNASCAVIMNGLIELANECETCLLMLHHSGKASSGKGAHQYANRGASAFPAHSRTVIQLTRPDEDAKKKLGISPDQQVISMIWTKTSYTPTSYRPTYFEVAPGGVLVETSCETLSLDVAQALADAITAGEYCLTSSEIERGTGDRAHSLRADVAARIGFPISRSSIASAIQSGLKNGVMTTVTLKTGRTARCEIRAGNVRVEEPAEPPAPPEQMRMAVGEGVEGVDEWDYDDTPF